MKLSRKIISIILTVMLVLSCVPMTVSAAQCTCGTDDPELHATNCEAYIKQENPTCYCVEKCTEYNVWCDVCGFDYTACNGTDKATAYKTIPTEKVDLVYTGAEMDLINYGTADPGYHWRFTVAGYEGDPYFVFPIDLNAVGCVANEYRVYCFYLPNDYNIMDYASRYEYRFEVEVYPAVSVAPVGAKGLKCTGKAQNLLASKGEVIGGVDNEMLYSVTSLDATEPGEFSTSAVATEQGTYKVWYKARAKTPVSNYGQKTITAPDHMAKYITVSIEHSSDVTSDNGFCPNGCYEPATDSNGDSYYEIDNAGKLYWFAQQVNSGNTSINAILTADIVVNEGNISDIYKTARVWTPIGNGTNRYTGTFNGNNKTVSGLCITVSKNYYGLFGSVGTNGVVKNVGVINSIFSGSTFIAGIVGDNYGTIENCYYTGSASAGMFCAGIAGRNGNTGIIKNCFFTGNISGANYSFITLQSEGIIENCYYTKNSTQNIVDKFEGTTEKSNEAFESGEVAYLLGDAYGQTIGTDKLPVLGGSKVYLVKNCKGEFVKYSNTNEIIHNSFDKNGICNICRNAYLPATLNSNGYYEINNAGNLMWFAQQVNNGSIKEHKVKLTNDIVIPDNIVWTPINYPDGIQNSVFDGNGHSITMNQNSDNGTNSGKNYGLFTNYNYSTVQNLVLKGSITVNTTANVGAVSGSSYRTTFRNVTSYMNITNNCTTGGNVGGIVGYFGGKHANGLYSLVENCAVYADVSGYIAGGIVGQGWNGTQYYDIKNCAYVGNVTGTNIAGAIVGYHNTDSNTSRFTNIYWNEKDNLGFYGLRDTTNQVYTNTVAKTAEQFASGEVAYLLGEAFGQTIGTDKLPVLGGKTVYQITNCKGDIFYSNTNENIGHVHETIKGYDATCTTTGLTDGVKCSLCGGIIVEQAVINTKAHEYNANGFCSLCDYYEPATDSDGDSYYEIDNAGKLYWFAQQVNSGNTSINAILTADITVNEGEITENSTNAREWTPIGDEDNQYNGIFDGNNKTVSGLYFNNESAECVGLFSYVGKNAEIKNVGVVNSYFKGYNYVGGVVGYKYSGTITNCYNTGTVSGSNYVGGVVGYSNYIINNCYNTGTVSGKYGYVGGVVGVNIGIVKNCYNTGTVSGNVWYVGGVVGENWATVTNCQNTGTISSSNYVGGVVGENDLGTVTNCQNTGTVSGKYGYVGGVVGDNDLGTVTNCYNTGTVSGNDLYVGGVVGYSNCIINNCYNTGTVSGNSNVGGVVGYNDKGIITNCYYLDTAYTGSLAGSDIADSAEAKTAEQFANGEVAYLLGEAFGQTIGTDELPVLGGAKVYYGYETYVSTEKTYSNSPLYDVNYKIGDVDLDGRVTIRDASTLSKCLAECITLTDCQLSTADANGDGELNINDVTYIQKIIAEII